MFVQHRDKMHQTLHWYASVIAFTLESKMQLVEIIATTAGLSNKYGLCTWNIGCNNSKTLLLHLGCGFDMENVCSFVPKPWITNCNVPRWPSCMQILTSTHQCVRYIKRNMAIGSAQHGECSKFGQQHSNKTTKKDERIHNKPSLLSFKFLDNFYLHHLTQTWCQVNTWKEHLTWTSFQVNTWIFHVIASLFS